MARASIISIGPRARCLQRARREDLAALARRDQTGARLGDRPGIPLGRPVRVEAGLVGGHPRLRGAAVCLPQHLSAQPAPEGLDLGLGRRGQHQPQAGQVQRRVDRPVEGREVRHRLRPAPAPPGGPPRRAARRPRPSARRCPAPPGCAGTCSSSTAIASVASACIWIGSSPARRRGWPAGIRAAAPRRAPARRRAAAAACSAARPARCRAGTPERPGRYGGAVDGVPARRRRRRGGTTPPCPSGCRVTPQSSTIDSSISSPRPVPAVAA